MVVLRQTGLRMWLSLCATLVVTMLLCSVAAADSTVIDLGNLGGSYAGANAINDLGQVVGGSATANWDLHAFLWQDGTILDLGSLQGGDTGATGINNRGQVIGFAWLADGSHAWLWQNGSMSELVSFSGGYSCYPSAISSSGTVVGLCWVGTGETHAFIWRAGKMADLWTLGCPLSEANDINARGDILGHTANGPALCTRNGLTPICLLENDCGYATALNDGGQIVGIAADHAVLWVDGVTTDLGTLGGGYSRANNINNRGEVVGYSTIGTPDAPGPGHAFLWNGIMHDLGVIGEIGDHSSSMAMAINRSGSIVGQSFDAESNAHAVLWPALIR